MTRLAAAPLERPLFKRGIPRLVLIEDEGQPFRRFNELRRTEDCQEGAWNATDLGEARGKQELFTRQSPQRLKLLREHALIESAVSSNRIEGVTVDQDRVRSAEWRKKARS